MLEKNVPFYRVFEIFKSVEPILIFYAGLAIILLYFSKKDKEIPVFAGMT